MPFYEFYCDACHRVFNYYSKQINTDKSPDCPRCEKKSIQRLISNFSPLRDMVPLKDRGGFLTKNDPQAEYSKQFLNDELKKINTNNPRQMATVLKKLGDLTGNNLGSNMQKVLSQIEQGGNIEELQIELESILTKYEETTETEFGTHQSKTNLPPAIDEEVYDL